MQQVCRMGCKVSISRIFHKLGAAATVTNREARGADRDGREEQQLLIYRRRQARRVAAAANNNRKGGGRWDGSGWRVSTWAPRSSGVVQRRDSGGRGEVKGEGRGGEGRAVKRV